MDLLKTEMSCIIEQQLTACFILFVRQQGTLDLQRIGVTSEQRVVDLCDSTSKCEFVATINDMSTASITFYCQGNIHIYKQYVRFQCFMFA